MSQSPCAPSFPWAPGQDLVSNLDWVRAADYCWLACITTFPPVQHCATFQSTTRPVHAGQHDLQHILKLAADCKTHPLHGSLLWMQQSHSQSGEVWRLLFLFITTNQVIFWASMTTEIMPVPATALHWGIAGCQAEVIYKP